MLEGWNCRCFVFPIFIDQIVKIGIMRKCLLLVFLLFYSVESHTQILGFSLKDDSKKVDIPFEMYNNLIVLPVVLNDQIPLKFILDTGVRTAILTEKAFSDILGLKYSRKYEIGGLGKEKTIEAYVTSDVTLTLPGVLGRGHALIVLNEDYLELRNYLGTDVHGILGYELFSRFIVKIDYDKKVVTLMTPDKFTPKRSYQELPMSVEDTKPYITGVVKYPNQGPLDVKLLLDTGASHGLFLQEDSDPNIFVPKNFINSELGRGLGGILEGKISRVNYFHIGEYCWKNPIVTFPTSHGALDSLKYGRVRRNGSIGGEILSRLKVVFDFPQERVFIKRGKEYKEDFTYNLSGILVKAKGSRLNTFEIVKVRKNSTGETAGFKEGDIIRSINNVSSSNMNLNHVVNFLNAKEGKKLKIEIKRDDQILKKVFRLKSQI